MPGTVNRSFEGRAEFHQAIIEALAVARHDLIMVDHDFQTWPLSSVAGEQALRSALLQGARVRMLVVKAAWLERHGDRFMRVRRAFSYRVSVREIPETLRVEESVLLVDRQHLVRRAHHESLSGRLILADPAQLEHQAPRYDAIWDESTECLAATRLGL